jgi:hypothetical protein
MILSGSRFEPFSITDACAFYANCINDITVVRIFGAFIGTMVNDPFRTIFCQCFV